MKTAIFSTSKSNQHGEAVCLTALKRQLRHALLADSEGVMFGAVGDSTYCKDYFRERLSVSTQISFYAFVNRVS